MTNRIGGKEQPCGGDGPGERATTYTALIPTIGSTGQHRSVRMLGRPPEASLALPFPDELPFSCEPILDIVPFAAAPLYPDLVGPLANEEAHLQLSRHHLELSRQFTDRADRARVADLPLQPPVAFGLPPKLAYSLHRTPRDPKLLSGHPVAFLSAASSQPADLTPTPRATFPLMATPAGPASTTGACARQNLQNNGTRNSATRKNSSSNGSPSFQ
jgi:hypothetical protein